MTAEPSAQNIPTSARKRRTPRPRTASSVPIIAFIVGVALGLGGGLFYSWAVNPVVSTDVAPWQLNKQGQDNWIIAASLAWARDGDLLLVATRLNELRLNNDTFQRVADLACELARSSYAQTDTGQTAIRSMVRLAESQGKPGCANDLIVVNTPTPPRTVISTTRTPTRSPPATKTATPEPRVTFTPELINVQPTNTAPPGKFTVVRYEPYCNARSSGLIEVLVQEANSKGIRGVQVGVEWAEGSDRFYTGLKPERDDGYADFKMQADRTYTVLLPGLSEASSPISAVACTDRQNGGTALTSYRLYFRRSAR